MKKVFYLALFFLLLTMGSFTTEKSILSNGDPSPYACWDFADNESQNNYFYGSSYAEDYEIWLWHYDFCMEGLYAPALYAK